MRVIFFLLFCSTVADGQSDSSFVMLLEEYQRYDRRDSTDVWGVQTDAAVQEEIAFLEDLRSRVPAPERLSDALRTDRALLDFVLDDRLYRLRFGHHLFPLDAEGGFLASVIYRFSGRPITTEEAYRKRIGALRGLPEFFANQQRNMRGGLLEGKVNPFRVIELNLALIDRQLATPVGESIFVDSVLDEAGKAELTRLTRDSIYPAYASLRDFLVTEYLPALPPGIGIAEITDGKEFYRQRVRFFTSTDLTPEEVFATGEAEVARIRAEMDTIIARTEFAGTYAEFLGFLRSDAQFYAASPQALLDRAAWITNRIQTAAPRYFSQLPRMPLVVAPVPAALAPNYTGGRYSPGSYTDQRAGQFWVNTYDLPSRPLYTLPALALHEGVPGHHTQMMLAAELEGMSDFRRDLYLSAFGEGWALYCEYLGEEMGIYETDYEKFGRLTYEMWRACRLVVDPGMHYFGWSRERAVEYMAANTALSLREVNSEIDRYIGWPGQAVSYKMGELTIRRLRKEAEAALGDNFDLAEFHKLVLGDGAVTMALLEETVHDYIARKTDD
ncbi:uncharacterized protein (DUF885 family) [Lewinella aquimaris]|uniref:Uncharacterized protein (DUF885 family) n=1 Tax=Neolewinella aquimaris TaxID=1835722 RepID=A0A840E929_9BACT|nr:DUF885 domain-containing protein [Neolewinella aquimaris]MBB4080443.1 uncharacterized protein (DUF885 family) [Neolewinella aquimaris]